MYLCLGGSKDDVAFDDNHRERAFKGKKFCYHVSNLPVNGKAQDFVKKLLTVNHFERPLVSQMLSHPWLELDADVIESINQMIKANNPSFLRS